MLIGHSLDATQLEEIKADPDIQVMQKLRVAPFILGINLEHPVLNNKYVRKAISAAIPREKFANDVLQGLAIPATSILNELTWVWDESITVPLYDLDQAKEEFLVRFKLSMEILEKGLKLNKEKDYELAIRFTKDFYEENKDFILSLVKLFNKPVLVEMWEERFFYFVLKWEFNFVDNLDKASALSTDQIDIENAKHYEITYVDEKGETQYPLVLHCSPSGGIERGVYSMLEKAHRDSLKGEAPILPLWLAPTQVRVIPVGERFLGDAEKLMKKIEGHRIRVDLDDRSISLGKKVREAEREWVNYVLVIGEKELNSDVLSVRDREAGKKSRKLKLKELIIEIKEKTEDKPFKPLTLPKLLSKRPQFAF